MAEWTQRLEEHIRKVGDYVEKEMGDLLNVKGGVTGTSVRIVFRAATVGLVHMNNACIESGIDFGGIDFSNGWLGNLERLCEIAEANKSDAADKIKKALPIARQLAAAFKAEKAAGVRAKVRLARSLGVQY